ncbi:cobalt transporter [Thermococcus chitonophagus]|uniref:Additional substrate-specific component NikN of nickel ECF transporter n=1 Tax=Thermococcus chitonophagus TaxID=54262 RepID=A0A170SLS9_9EURY|nr:PDGLE domain-containing protein [Thermococcus chitonophagus]ASJ17378.1 cobalt transporter [Thermococcus chitonophagus]CUX78014.1 Additional substrate-specific component NikN of nickel ECF transporter [Thermococcus chitonophagus]
MRNVVKGILIILAILAIVLPLASSNPDGLEATMEKVGLEEKPIYHAPLDYGETWGQGMIAGIIGITLAFVIGYGMAKLAKGA